MNDVAGRVGLNLGASPQLGCGHGRSHLVGNRGIRDSMTHLDFFGVRGTQLARFQIAISESIVPQPTRDVDVFGGPSSSGALGSLFDAGDSPSP